MAQLVHIPLTRDRRLRLRNCWPSWLIVTHSVLQNHKNLAIDVNYSNSVLVLSFDPLDASNFQSANYSYQALRTSPSLCHAVRFWLVCGKHHGLQSKILSIRACAQHVGNACLAKRQTLQRHSGRKRETGFLHCWMHTVVFENLNLGTNNYHILWSTPYLSTKIL